MSTKLQRQQNPHIALMEYYTIGTCPIDDLQFVTDGELNTEVMSVLSDIEQDIKSLNNRYKEVKEKLLHEMESNGILKYIDEHVSVTYVPSSDRETFDKKKFQADNPVVYDKYVSMSPVSPSIRIKVKENK